MPRPSGEIEDQATEIVRKIRAGVRVARRDDGKHGSIRDCDVVYPDGHQEPLEVTRTALPELNQAPNAHAKGVGFAIDIEGLRRQWIVYSTTDSSFRDWSPVSLHDFLLPLEAHGMSKLLLPLTGGLPAAAEAARSLGIAAAIAHDGRAGRSWCPRQTTTGCGWMTPRILGVMLSKHLKSWRR